MDKKQILSASLAVVMTVSTLTGCSGSITGRDAKSIPLEPELTQQEVLDYYAKQLDYDTVVSRNIKTDINYYETSDVKDEAKLKLIAEALGKAEGVLSRNSYSLKGDNKKFLQENLYKNMKATLNDKKLTNGKIASIKQALGYYFVDVDYNIGPAEIGEFTSKISLIGMNGAFKYSGSQNMDVIDKGYIAKAIKVLNKYYDTERLNYKASFNESTGEFIIKNLDAPSNDYTATTVVDESPLIEEVVTQPVEDVADATANDNNAVVEDVVEDIGDAEKPDKVEGTTNNKKDNEDTKHNYKPIVRTYTPRSPKIDLKTFNNIVGSGHNSSYIPDLYHIYITPSDESGISGIGLYPSGGLGLALFGFNRSELSGACTLRYVFKEDLVNPSELSCENIYPTYYEISSGFNANNDSIIPEFLDKEFSTLIERSDRAIVNCDITGLMSGDIYTDIGMAVLTGYTSQSSHLLKNMSTLRRIISRDTDNNAYLVEIERYTQEGSKSADVYGSYKDQIYAVIEQHGSEFVITDWMIMNRQLVTEPDINPDAATAKRIVSLGLTDAVNEDTKTDVISLLNNLYTASSYRVLNGPKEIDGTTIEKGMYDCFDGNVEMLSSSRKEELNSHLRSLLVKYGTKTTATMNGKVTEWLGGTDKQVEFTTEEVITYQGRTDGVYMTCYYLVSCMEDVWVIDDIQILSQDELSGDGLASAVNRISN